jgi:hypothetical protein
MKIGDVVRVRFFGNLVEPRRIVQVEENTIVICDSVEWENAAKGNRIPEGIRVPIDDLQK